MNWNLFYLINKEFLNTMALGAIYVLILGIMIYFLKSLIDTIKDDGGEQ